MTIEDDRNLQLDRARQQLDDIVEVKESFPFGRDLAAVLLETLGNQLDKESERPVFPHRSTSRRKDVVDYIAEAHSLFKSWMDWDPLTWLSRENELWRDMHRLGQRKWPERARNNQWAQGVLACATRLVESGQLVRDGPISTAKERGKAVRSLSRFIDLGDVPADIRTGLIRIVPALGESVLTEAADPPNVDPEAEKDDAYNLAQQQLSDMEELRHQFPFGKDLAGELLDKFRAWLDENRSKRHQSRFSDIASAHMHFKKWTQWDTLTWLTREHNIWNDMHRVGPGKWSGKQRSRLWAECVHHCALAFLEAGQLNDLLNERLARDGASKTAEAKRKAAASLRRLSQWQNTPANVSFGLRAIAAEALDDAIIDLPQELAVDATYVQYAAPPRELVTDDISAENADLSRQLTGDPTDVVRYGHPIQPVASGISGDVFCGLYRVHPNSQTVKGPMELTIQAKQPTSKTKKRWRKRKEPHVVAIKEFRLMEDKLVRIRKYFVLEALTWRELSRNATPYVVKFFGAILQPNRLCLVSEWMPGGNVVDYLASRSEPIRNESISRIVDALSWIHHSDRRIVHGDIKGVNVLVDKNGLPRLADFGLSRLILDDTLTSDVGVSKMVMVKTEPSIGDISSNIVTSMPSLMSGAGTKRYMAPELLDPEYHHKTSGKATIASDVYAFAMLVYEICASHHPFIDVDSEDMVVVKVAYQGERPTRPTALTSDALWCDVERCWRTEAEERPTMQSLKSSSWYSKRHERYYY